MPRIVHFDFVINDEIWINALVQTLNNAGIKSLSAVETVPSQYGNGYVKCSMTFKNKTKVENIQNLLNQFNAANVGIQPIIMTVEENAPNPVVVVVPKKKIQVKDITRMPTFAEMKTMTQQYNMSAFNVIIKPAFSISISFNTVDDSQKAMQYFNEQKVFGKYAHLKYKS